jgi:hypothetical protein
MTENIKDIENDETTAEDIIVKSNNEITNNILLDVEDYKNNTEVESGNKNGFKLIKSTILCRSERKRSEIEYYNKMWKN